MDSDFIPGLPTALRYKYEQVLDIFFANRIADCFWLQEKCA